MHEKCTTLVVCVTVATLLLGCLGTENENLLVVDARTSLSVLTANLAVAVQVSVSRLNLTAVATSNFQATVFVYARLRVLSVDNGTAVNDRASNRDVILLLQALPTRFLVSLKIFELRSSTDISTGSVSFGKFQTFPGNQSSFPIVDKLIAVIQQSNDSLVSTTCGTGLSDVDGGVACFNSYGFKRGFVAKFASSNSNPGVMNASNSFPILLNVINASTMSISPLGNKSNLCTHFNDSVVMCSPSATLSTSPSMLWNVITTLTINAFVATLVELIPSASRRINILSTVRQNVTFRFSQRCTFEHPSAAELDMLFNQINEVGRGMMGIVISQAVPSDGLFCLQSSTTRSKSISASLTNVKVFVACNTNNLSLNSDCQALLDTIPKIPPLSCVITNPFRYLLYFASHADALQFIALVTDGLVEGVVSASVDNHETPVPVSRNSNQNTLVAVLVVLLLLGSLAGILVYCRWRGMKKQKMKYTDTVDMNTIFPPLHLEQIPWKE